MDWNRFLEVLDALSAEGVDYIIVGAVALGLHGHPRGTRDLDLFVRPDPANIDRLRAALRRVWDDPCIDEITAEDLCGDFPAIAYGPPDDSLPMDILTRLGEAFSYQDLDAEQAIVEGRQARIATALTLFRMKKDTVRPQDHADAAWLAHRFGLGSND
jgi:hypothetical protein